ncbi:D-glycero-D-manno-heptose 1-phosphate guanosyltransferase [Shewanella mangrovi]|uniref:D-glycero-D-manno-heptose 1-phosphate guanosyltransferase n=1 Tax=Shewanella mangrovi TaxID=1515746 RepID=A0A094LQF9_9GAMM|nr:EAL domain-containing protein [Shewanella mangrovi]KFZ37383.1 D-glycero-D-manno-heptose 1-phosphate guanosyltransferase [Shewanella mangrovi]
MAQQVTASLQQTLMQLFDDAPLVTLEQNVDRALELISAQLACDGVFVLSPVVTPGYLVARNLYLKSQFNTGQGVREWALGHTPFFRALVKQPKLFSLTSLSQLPKDAIAEKQMLRQWHVKSLLVLPPVKLGETHIAVGAVNCQQECEWSEHFIEQLQQSQTLIAAAMELTRIAQALLVSERRYHELFHQLPLACAQLNRGDELVMMNRIAEQTLLNGDSCNLLRSVREEDRDNLRDTLAMVRDGVLGQAWCEVGIEHAAEMTWQRLGLYPAQSDRRNLIVIAEDVSERRRLASELSFHANYDALTGLPNRTHFEDLLQRLLMEHDQTPVCIAFVDLDQFRVINNMSGHMAGDRLICQIAERLKLLVRKGDIVARLGGDEFGILMHACNRDSATVIAERICSQIRGHQFSWQGREHKVSASIGIAPMERSEDDIYTVMAQADAACRLAKDAGRNQYQVYDERDNRFKRFYTEMTASLEIIEALANDRFQLYFQEIRAVNRPANGLHLEILLRMKRDNGELLSPGVFFPAAERYDLVARVDRWVIDNLLRWGNTHPELWQQCEQISVNLSAASIGDHEFMEWLEKQLLAEADLAKTLCFEITETAVLTQVEQACKLLDMLQCLGCKLAMDDFGAGFSSFSYLKKLALDYVKIDGQFVVNLCQDNADRAIVAAVCQLAQELQFATVAEFVESAQILTELEHIGVDYAQGYAIHKPMPLTQITSLLK